MSHHTHGMKMYGEIKLYAGSASLNLAQKIADYLQQPLSPREIIQFPNENIFSISMTAPAGKMCTSSRARLLRYITTSWNC